MGRFPRGLPEGGALVEITNRTLQGRYLLRPSPELREVTVGVLARAQEAHPVRICALHFLSNHFHLLIDAADVERMAGFMRYLDGNLSKEVGRLVGWKGPLWGDRYHHTVVSEAEGDQVRRLAYVLGQGLKENLVERPEDWPGLHGVEALLTDEPLRGWWFDRTREHRARLRGKKFGKYEFATEETLTLAPLPCWKHLAPEEVRRRVAELVAQVIEDAAAERRRSGKEVLGAAAVCDQNPHEAPPKLKRSPKPLFHAAGKKLRQELREAFALFLGAYLEAAKKLREEERDVLFPKGCYPPGLPYVRPATARGP